MAYFKAKQYHLTNNHLVLYHDTPYQHVEVCRLNFNNPHDSLHTKLQIESLYVVKGTWPEIIRDPTAPWVSENVSTAYSKLLLDTGRILYGHFGPLGPMGSDGTDVINSIEAGEELICRDRKSRTYLTEHSLTKEIRLHRSEWCGASVALTCRAISTELDSSTASSVSINKNKPKTQWALCNLLALAKQKGDLTLFEPNQSSRTWRRIQAYQVRYNPGKGYLLLLIGRDQAELVLLPCSL